MGQRKRLGLLFSYNEKWIGGTYYILNLIHALNLLTDNTKPFITIISSKKTDFNYIKNETKYPYLTFLKNRSEQSLWEKSVNAFSLRLVKKKIANSKLPNNFDLLFPNPVGEYFSLIDDSKKAYWIADFQELHLPSFFSTDELIAIKQRQILQAYKAEKMVLSSLDAKNDFKFLYPDSKAKVFVIPFSVTHPPILSLSFDKIARKYSIDRPYYFAPNQFWAHKNQIVIIKAVKELTERKKNVLVLFSGREDDHRNPSYTSSLKRMVIEESLENNIKFLGFIDRAEQLCIMKNAISVIQPSLFEGWSTVVEDAKALNKKIILSDIKVHKEQLPENDYYIFFNPGCEEQLADAILQMEANNYPDPTLDYENNKRNHAIAFLSLFENNS
ncbi:glycosyltransferase family 1 protein [Spirosoma harenae]